MLATHLDAEKRYEVLRKTALEIAHGGLSPQEKSIFKLETITQAALTETLNWAKSATRRVDWDWISG